ncbi:hypothetical protein, variant [Exophiala mesophila]|uniref:AMP-activated protein kinase glycogen-binding domain-containing protein n=1 Tax=Exophiala mesophila TaxID=212818 RepID=A0A0D1Z5H1_EXOME|nr:uncharacterized protein PV10_07387 [Exophiala mesophila]XP_016221617.1 hypothetical protein, variant [Exophiala mesophila]KIV90042.1 hypothetical protein PV10_07387 [Exophiala mesophila]KIV90043.1 hypothetical protein, variant [Exophiala mesophila]
MVTTTIRFSRPDVQPPVYVAGSFSKWSPIEMKLDTNESTESTNNHFSYQTDLEPGKYEFKFKLGPGDWWVLDESMPSVTDPAGNVNNLLNVEESKPTEEPSNIDSANVLPTAPQEIPQPLPSTVVKDDNVNVKSHSRSPSQSQSQSNIGKRIVADNSEPKAAVIVSDEKPEKVTPDVEFGDGSKDDTIPDVAPPPYSPPLVEGGPELTSSALKSESASMEDANGRDNSRTHSVKSPGQGKRGSQSWIDSFGGGNVALVVAAIIIPVAVSYLWYR